MEWVPKLEAKSGWGDVVTIEDRSDLAESKDLLGELARLVLQTQMGSGANSQCVQEASCCSILWSASEGLSGISCLAGRLNIVMPLPV